MLPQSIILWWLRAARENCPSLCYRYAGESHFTRNDKQQTIDRQRESGSAPLSHFKALFERLGGEVDCSGSIKYLLHWICYSYQSAVFCCVIWCTVQSRSISVSCLSPQQGHTSGWCDKHTRWSHGATRCDLWNYIQFSFLRLSQDRRVLANQIFTVVSTAFHLQKCECEKRSVYIFILQCKSVYLYITR